VSEEEVLPPPLLLLLLLLPLLTLCLPSFFACSQNTTLHVLSSHKFITSHSRCLHHQLSHVSRRPLLQALLPTSIFEPV
jgi:hypothetical protein